MYVKEQRIWRGLPDLQHRVPRTVSRNCSISRLGQAQVRRSALPARAARMVSGREGRRILHTLAVTSFSPYHQGSANITTFSKVVRTSYSLPVRDPSLNRKRDAQIVLFKPCSLPSRDEPASRDERKSRRHSKFGFILYVLRYVEFLCAAYNKIWLNSLLSLDLQSP